MKTQHTQGEWKLELSDFTIRTNWFKGDTMGDYRGCIVADLKSSIGIGQEDVERYHKGYGGRMHCMDEVKSNAKLIAAAPELLEALQFARTILEKNGIETGMDTIETAIKKATS